ncbi:hypothetical protein NLM59_02990 [Weeksellaceae bacterium KMM 9724]|uniref:hypothetical protein n=1 Tax=Profundicola chukchiensis TaxID=2961959 RepID=UPI00243ED376|nr:hypothetical protein [Profundicola chukchiensis]MDG4949879.1 hypothetical protein [Profundicola chukchiensis]
MIIEKPYIDVRENETYLIANIIDEVNNLEKEIYDLAIDTQFSFPNEVKTKIQKYKLKEIYIGLKIRLYNLIKSN